MKTTIEIPDALFRKAKATAAQQGIPLKDLFTYALQDHLARGSSEKPPTPAWRSAFGALRHLHKETKRINGILEEEFEQIDEDQWR